MERSLMSTATATHNGPAPVPHHRSGALTQTFVEPLEPVFVESTSNESILDCEADDPAKLRAILSWLFERGIEIVSVAPHHGGLDFVDQPKRNGIVNG